jgi:hypothetical protein
VKTPQRGNLPAAYSDAQLGKKNLCLGRVLVSRGGNSAYWFHVPMSYQAIAAFSLHQDFQPIS